MADISRATTSCGRRSAFHRHCSPVAASAAPLRLHHSLGRNAANRGALNAESMFVSTPTLSTMPLLGTAVLVLATGLESGDLPRPRLGTPLLARPPGSPPPCAPANATSAATVKSSTLVTEAPRACTATPWSPFAIAFAAPREFTLADLAALHVAVLPGALPPCCTSRQAHPPAPVRFRPSD